MQAIANLIVAAIDLVELEGRAFHRSALRLLWKSLALIGCAVVGLAGLGFIAVFAFWMLAKLIGWPAATGVTGLLLLGGAFGLFLYARTLPAWSQSVRSIDGLSAEERAKQDALKRAEADVEPRESKLYSAQAEAAHAATST